MIHSYIASLVQYGLRTGLIEECDKIYITNSILEVLGIDSCQEAEPKEIPLEEILKGLLDYAVEKGLCADNITDRDLMDTKLMGILTPRPHEVIRTFREKYAQSPVKATQWYYKFSQDTDYVRRYRIAKDMRWKYRSEYGDLDITINLSKPEKDPMAVAAAKLAPQTGYPKCLLCAENEGYAGHGNHPARQNHRILPITIADSQWFLQYSPYVYYNEHCIAFNSEHTPMVINKAVFGKLLDFVTVFPHYFVGSNADLPIVGGSILSHEHFQGGQYTFAIETAPVDTVLTFKDFEDVAAGIVKWPMSVIRLSGKDKTRVAELAGKIFQVWRTYTDASAFIFAQTNGVVHNTITPIARRRGEAYEMDLVLRNNITTEEHPLGVYHPHADKHHIKRENIGLIEAMGLAVLPGRLKKELAALAQAACEDRDISKDATLQKHASWLAELKAQYVFTEDNAMEILLQETGKVFTAVLEDAGVYKNTYEGRMAFRRFADQVNRES